jgi:hypothetical protein
MRLKVLTPPNPPQTRRRPPSGYAVKTAPQTMAKPMSTSSPDSYEQKTARVTYDPYREGPAVLVKATTDAGFPPTHLAGTAK